MALDAITLHALVRELNTELSAARVDRIYQPERDEIFIYFRTRTEEKKLVISANGSNPRLHLAASSKENPAEPPMFCMLLRKYILGARLASVTQTGFDRIAVLTFECASETGNLTVRRLICELMGIRSNIIFTDRDDMIIDAVKRVDETESSRIVLPHFKYELPPSPKRLDPMEASASDFEDVLFDAPQNMDCDRAIVAAVSGISPLLAREAVFEATLNANMTVGELNVSQKKDVAKRLYDMFERVRKNEFTPCVVTDKKSGKVTDFSAFFIKQYTDAATVEFTDAVSDAMESFYFKRDAAVRMKSRGASLLKTVNNALERCRRKLTLQQDKLKEAEGRERLRIEGELITANLHKIKKGDTYLMAQNYYEEGCPEIKISLDASLSASQNAQLRFKKYAKAKNAEEKSREWIAITLSEIEYLNSVLLSIEEAKTQATLDEIQGELRDAGYIKGVFSRKKSKAAITPPIEYKFNGYSIFSGRNNLQNDYLTLKLGRARDMWLHVKNIAGCHVLIKYSGEDFPEEVVHAAAVIAATNSKAKNSSRVEVDYCPVSHVKKPSGAKAGMVIYEGYSTAIVDPDEKFVEKIQLK